MSHNQNSSVPLEGYLYAFSDQGLEGTHWTFVEDDGVNKPKMHAIENGDLLRVFNDKSKRDVIFDAEVDLDYEVNKKPNWMIPSWILQQIDGIGTVHGIQKEMNPDQWGEMFTQEKPALLFPRNPKP